MRRPTFLRVYSSDATEKDDEATPIMLLLPIQVHPPGGKQGLTAVLGSLAWAGVRRLLCRPPDRALLNHR